MIEPFLALEASAGSGKTFALSVRYIALVLSGASVKSITALTFTKKAASEMSERIINAFLNLHLETKKAERAELAMMFGVSEDEVVAMRDKKEKEFLQSELKITTFDAFFSSILRSFSLNLGLSPDFESKSAHSGALMGEFIKFINPNGTLLTALARYIVLSQRSQGNFFETLEAFYENFSQIKFTPFFDAKAGDDALQILRELREFVVKNGGSSTAQKAFTADSVDEIFEKSFLPRDSLEYQTFNKIYKPEMDEKFAELKSALARYARHLESFRLGELDRFLQCFRMALFALNSRLNELTFADITKLTHELLTGNLDKQILYFRLDARVTHLLIDEFQDTNVAQYEIMLPLIAEIVAGYGQNGLGSFFYVGDVKQSIYRFRGGKKELFGKLADDFVQIKRENLTKNYRSARNLVEFINMTFAGKIAGYVPQTPNESADGYLKIVVADDVVSGCADEVQTLLNLGVQGEEITVLCWKNDDVRAICEALNARGIAARDEGAMALRNSPAVFALINYAKFCLFGDEIYRQNARAFLGRELARLNLNLAKNAQQNLLYLAQKSGMSLQNLDLLKLISLATQAKSIINFIFDFESSDATSAQNSEHGVRVMTVHKSKGLEFERVVLADRVGRGRADGRNFICEYDTSAGYELRLKLKNREFVDEDYAKIKEYSQTLDKEEELNKLYVAMTRAKNSLIVVKKADPSGTSPSYFSAYESNGKPVCYLDLEPFEQGSVHIGPVSEPQPVRAQRKIELVSVSRESSISATREDEKNLHAIYFGLALHYLLEMSAVFSEDALREAAVAMRNKFGKFLNLTDLSDVENRALNLIKDVKFRTLVDGARVLKEQGLNFNGEQKQLDLLCERGEELVVIDYKSSKFSVEKNIAQVREYKQILTQIYPEKRVRGMLFYLLRGGIEVIEI